MNKITFTREQVIERLGKSDAALVTFTKLNGEKREMRCTINNKQIPEEFAPKGSEKTFNPDNIRVFDLENKGWRSFKLDSIISIK